MSKMEKFTANMLILAVALCMMPAHAGRAGLPDGLIGYWPLDEGSGTTTDDMSGQGNNGVLINGPTWVTGKIGYAVAFGDNTDRGIYMNTDGTVDSAAIPAVLRPVTAVSVSAWAKTDSFGSYEGIFANYFWTGPSRSGYALQTSLTGGWWWWVKTNTGNDIFLSLTAPGTTGQWVYLVGTFDRNAAGGQGEAKLYVNGSQYGATFTGGYAALDIDWIPIPWNCGIGMYNDDNENYQFNGAIDEVAVWNRALSPAEVTELYNGGAGKSVLGSGHVIVTETGGSTEVTEGGANDTYDLVLGSQPSQNVLITAAPADAQIDLGAGAGAAVTLTFTSGNWGTAQTVTVTATNDDVYEGKIPHTTNIDHTTQSLDDNYDDIPVASVAVSVTDNEETCGDWGYLPTDLNKDCYVDLCDYAEFALEWLMTNQ